MLYSPKAKQLTSGVTRGEFCNRFACARTKTVGLPPNYTLLTLRTCGRCPCPARAGSCSGMLTSAQSTASTATSALASTLYCTCASSARANLKWTPHISRRARQTHPLRAPLPLSRPPGDADCLPLLGALPLQRLPGGRPGASARCPPARAAAAAAAATLGALRATAPDTSLLMLMLTLLLLLGPVAAAAGGPSADRAVAAVPPASSRTRCSPPLRA